MVDTQFTVQVMAQKRTDKTADPRWDRKQGVPKSPQMKRVVEQSSGRYSASEQSEQKRKGGRRGSRA
jgi:hypothetical protein